MMGRIEEFNCEGKNFIYIDFSGLRSGKEFFEQIELVKPVISKYPGLSVHTITNVEDIRIDVETKNIALEYLNHGKPYVKTAVIIGMDGIKKMMISTIIKLSGRKNVYFAFTKEKAIELILRQY